MRRLRQYVRRNPVSHALLVLGGILVSPAGAQNGSPTTNPGDEPSLMRTLADRGLHNLDDENWNLYSQFTIIGSSKPGFAAPYTNLNGSINSLLPTAEQSF